MILKRLMQTAIGLLALTSLHAAVAAPKVVVSNAPLHSLVSALMEGAGTPKLLTDVNAVQDAPLDSFQAAELITADMVIWTGAGFEASLAERLEAAPALESKLLTISNYIPLLARDQYDPLSGDRQVNRDLRFWNDPRLTVMAVKMITPRLVQLDPDHTELYLDNEIALLEKIRALGKEIASSLESYSLEPGTDLSEVDPYFQHRFLASRPVDAGSEYLRVAAPTGTAQKKCTMTEDKGGKAAGSALYFEMLRTKARAVASCMHHTADGMKTAHTGEGAVHGS